MSQIQKYNVGSRLKSLRESQGLSLRALSDICGLSINSISQIERGSNSPTVSTLQRLASALNLPITDFFLDETKQTVVFVENQTGLRLQQNGVVMESLGIGLTSQKLEPFRLIIQSKVGNLEDPISHSGEEFVHCLSGHVDYCVENRIFSMHPGDSLLFDATQLHAYRNKSDQPAELLVIFLASEDSYQVQRLHMV